ncbi:hypothetical protein AVEN_232563-1, partial [Araneus ventricosus]
MLTLLKENFTLLESTTSSPTPMAKEPEKSAMPLPVKSPILTRTVRRVHFSA